MVNRIRFQSAPLTKARGDSYGQLAKPIAVRFNPLPSPKQGETKPASPLRLAAVVSIRSPHQSKGRLATGCPPRPHRCCFNPLPSPKQGETKREIKLKFKLIVSIRSPHQSKGRPPPSRPRRSAAPVSIRSPHQSKGRPLSRHVPRHAKHGFNPLPSPKQGETGSGLRWASPQYPFQSAPLTKARGDTVRLACQPRLRRFNPLPSPKQGETGCVVDGRLEGEVSIRSPHQSKGRPLPAGGFSST